MSEEQELSIGRKMAPKIEKDYGVYDSNRLQEYVAAVGERLAKVSDRPDIFFHFTVLNSPIVNAFALPGGYVYITRGLLAYLNSEAELAGVLGHEIGHITARHAVRQYTKAASYQLATGVASVFFPEITRYGQFSDLVFMAITSGYSRKYEMEADKLGIKYISKSGYDPKAVSSVLKILELLERFSDKKTYTSLFSTHPKTEKRIFSLEREPNGESLPQSPVTGRENYLREIDGLVFGDDPREGIIFGNRFQHPEFRIEVFFPEGWSIKNMPHAVIAKDPDHDFQLELRVHSLTKRKSITEIAHVLSKKFGFKEIDGSQKKVNDLEAYVGTYEGRSREFGNIMARIGFFMIRDMAHYIIGFSRPGEFKKALPFFNNTIETFKKLSRQQAENIHPNRIRLHVAGEGETLATIIKKLGGSSGDVKTVALINAWDPEKLPELKPGMVIKVFKNQ